MLSSITTSPHRHITKSATLAVILARSGSKGLPRKNALPLGGQPMLAWTIQHAAGSERVDEVVVSTDGRELVAIAERWGAGVVRRPRELAGDAAPVDAAVRHAVQAHEIASGERVDVVAILYGNVPIRPADLTDRAVGKLLDSGCDSVQSVCRMGKTHPYWMKRLGGEAGDEMLPLIDNNIHRRQDLPPVYLLDGGVIAVTRRSLFCEGIDGAGDDPHAFLGRDRRAVVTDPGEVVDIDTPLDLCVAEAVLARAEGEASAARVA